MRLNKLYKYAIEAGIAHDPRGRDSVLRFLASCKKDYDALKDDERDDFELESLQNPYADSRILNGTGEEEIVSALVGVDIEVGEVLLADTLRARGKGPDMIIAHHPEGRPYANLYEVMGMQAEIYSRFGVPISTAESLMDKRIKDVERKLMPSNHTRSVDAARLLGIPFMCLHTPADNMVATYLQQMFDDKKPETVGDVMKLLKDIPEYKTSSKLGAGPKIVLGSKKRTAGKVFVDMTGGTGGPDKIYEGLARGGVNTIVGMHIGEDSRKEAEKNHLNVVIAGHIASDNLGINLLLDAIAKAASAPLDIMGCSGFTRVSRP